MIADRIPPSRSLWIRENPNKKYSPFWGLTQCWPFFTYLVGSYLFKVNNKNCRMMPPWNRFHSLFCCFHCWFWTNKHRLDMEVRLLGQLKRKMWSDQTEMMQGWLDGSAKLGLWKGFRQRNFAEEYTKIEEHEGMLTG